MPISKTKLKFIMTFLLLSLIPLMITNLLGISKSVHDTKQQTQEKLLGIAKAKQSLLNNHFNMMKHSAEGLANMPIIKNMASLHAKTSEKSTLALNPMYTEALATLRAFQENNWGIYHHVFMADSHGHVFLSPTHGDSKSSHLNEDISESPFFKAGLNKTTVTDFFGFEENDHFHQLLFQPIKNSSGETVGILLFEIEIDHIREILKENFALGKTGQIFLSTLTKIPVVKAKESLTDALESRGLDEALRFDQAVGDFSTNGKDVVGVYLKSQNYPWILVVEIDRQEAYAEINKQIIFLMFGMLSIFLLVGFFSTQFSNKLLNRLESVIRKLTETAAKTFHLAQNLNTSAESLSKGTTEQASALEETSSSLDEILSMTKQNAQNAIQASKETSSAKSSAEKGNAAMKELLQAMNNLQSSSQAVSKIIKTIEEIASQTNLLALNAAVEAAQAGEHGKGFAVVADEVRNLAQRAAEAARETTDLISQSVNETRQGFELANKTNAFIQEIINHSIDVDNVIQEIASANGEQSEGIDQISNAINQVDQVTQQNAASSIDQSRSANELNQQAELLNKLVQQLQSIIEGKK